MIYNIDVDDILDKDNRILDICKDDMNKRTIIICRTCDLSRIYMKLKYNLKKVSLIQYRYKWKYHNDDWNNFISKDNNILITDKLNLKINNIDIYKIIYYCKTIKCNIKSNNIYYFSE